MLARRDDAPSPTLRRIATEIARFQRPPVIGVVHPLPVADLATHFTWQIVANVNADPLEFLYSGSDHLSALVESNAEDAEYWRAAQHGEAAVRSSRLIRASTFSRSIWPEVSPGLRHFLHALACPGF